MDTERATELLYRAHAVADYMHVRAADHEFRPPTVEPVEDWDRFEAGYPGYAMEIEGVLGLTMPHLVNGDHVLTLTEGLARARHRLTQMTDPPGSIRRHVYECLMLVDAALAELDLTPDDPIVLAAAVAT